MLGISMSNVDPNMNAPGARAKALGNNPLAYASPSETVPSVFLDIAMSNVASLKAFLDRLRRCDAGHNHLLTGKKTLLAACAGGSGKGAVPCLDRLESFLADMEMQAADRLPVTRFNRSYLLPALEAAGGAFAAALSE